MDTKKYQTIIEKTAIFPKDIGIAYCALGLTGEAGEVAEKIKKLYRDVEFNKLDAVNKNLVLQESKKALCKELGDVLWYITALANEFDLTLGEIMLTNYNKLMARRQTNTLHGSGDDREELA